MADVDAKLAAAVKLAKTKTMFFAFVANGSDGKLLVDKKKIKPVDAEAAKKECGGGQIYRGKCTWMAEGMVFQVAKPAPASVANLTKKIIKSDAGLTVPVEYRVGTEADLEAEENETESVEEASNPPTVPPPPPPPSSAPPEANKAALSFATRLKTLQPMLQKVETTNKALATQAKTQIAEGNKAFVAKRYDEANAALDRAETLLKHVVTGTVKETAPPPPSADGDVMKRLNAMTADIKAALAGPDKARVQSLFVAVNGFIKNKDFAQANKTLDELASLVKQAPVAPPPAPPSDDASVSKEWERRVTAMEPQILAAQKTRAGEAKWMTMFMSAQDLGGEGDFTKSFAILDKLEGLLNASPDGGGPQLIASLQIWTAARANAVGQLAKLVQAFEQSDHPQAKEGVVLLQAIIKNLTPRPATATQVAELSRYLESDDIISEAEMPNPFGFTVSIRSPLQNALAEVKKHVA